MSYGGITFAHVLNFQIRIMLGDQQYQRCMKARKQKEILVACLRLGWNDAFRHTSKNQDGIKESEKETIILKVCESVIDEFCEYAKKTTTKDRIQYIEMLFSSNKFKQKFEKIKVIDELQSDKALCFGHIQKMFNMAIKLFLCLKICAEKAEEMNLDIELNPALFKTDFALDTADCPIDSIILSKLDACRKIKWSKIGHKNHPSSEYEIAQTAIQKELNDISKSNLCYDFENW